MFLMKLDYIEFCYVSVATSRIEKQNIFWTFNRILIEFDISRRRSS